ncbi:MAG: adenylate cyclase [Verrucomicrobiota bacterium]|jgi:adenylate cyclase
MPAEGLERSNEKTDRRTAWLESNGETFTIQGNCTIGRTPTNCVVLDSPKVSRRHAVINVQSIGEFWLIDLGSSNGTFLNHRRLPQPVRLSDRDEISIGERTFVFRQPEEITDAYRTTLAERTIREIENVPCWLLVADIENFTPLSRSLTSDKLAELIGGWVATCKESIEAHAGMIDKYLGDGFFAYWREDDNAAKNVSAALASLKVAQAKNEPRFRLALHFGLVAIGGVPSMGEESLMGKEVNFVFRMEKLAGSLGISVLTSDAGKAKLGDLMKCESAGTHELKGFEGKYEFFSC